MSFLLIERHLTVAEGRFDNLFDNVNGFEFWQTSMLGGIFDTFEFILSLGKVRFPSLQHWTEFIFALFCPWFYLGKTQAMVSELETGKPINIFGKGFSHEVRSAGTIKLKAVCPVPFPSRASLSSC